MAYMMINYANVNLYMNADLSNGGPDGVGWKYDDPAWFNLDVPLGVNNADHPNHAGWVNARDMSQYDNLIIHSSGTISTIGPKQ